jgi:hypothetical protein
VAGAPAHHAGRPAPLFRSGDRDHPDAVQCAADAFAAGRRPAGLGGPADGVDVADPRSHDPEPARAAAPCGQRRAVARRSAGRAGRQHRAAGLRRGSVAAGETRREVAPQLAQAASGSRCQHGADRSAHAHRSGRGRSVAGRAAAGPDPGRDRAIHRGRRLRRRADVPDGRATQRGREDRDCTAINRRAQLRDRPAHAARSPSRSDRGERAAGLAEGDRLWPAGLGRNDDGPLQGADRPASTGSPPRCSADRSSYRRGGAQPHAVRRPKSVRCKAHAAWSVG